MKPLHIGLLVLAGALGGAVIMKFTQRPKPMPAPVVAETIPPAAPAPAAPAVAAEEPAPQPEAAEPAKPSPVEEKPAPPRVTMPHRKPAPPKRPSPPIVAENRPPVEPPAPATPSVNTPAPTPVEEAPEPASTPAEEPAPAPAPPAPEPAPSVTLRSGLMVPVRLGEGLSSDHNQAGDTFTATLDSPLSADGFIIAERGARVEGRVVEAAKAGRVKGDAVLAVELTKLHTSDGQNVEIRTETYRKQAPKSTADDVGLVAAAAGVGAVIGAIAGGGKGAGIGAAAGGAAGVGGVAVMRGRPVVLPTEGKITFRLREPVTITERTDH